MKSLQESLLDDEDILMQNTGSNIFIEKFIKENYIINKGNIKINDDYTVDCDGDVLLRTEATNLTNGLFKWGVVSGSFECSESDNLKSLEGAPEEVGGYFDCYGCEKLKSLKGAPKIVKGDFDCSECEKLKSLKGSPEEVGGNFDCSFCDLLITLEGAPKIVKGDFNCNNILKLESFKGAPKKIEGNFFCNYAGNVFGDYDIRKYTNLKGEINISDY